MVSFHCSQLLLLLEARCCGSLMMMVMVVVVVEECDYNLLNNLEGDEILNHRDPSSRPPVIVWLQAPEEAASAFARRADHENQWW